MRRVTRLLVGVAAAAGMLVSVGGLASDLGADVPERRVAFSADELRDEVAADLARHVRPR